MKQDIITLNALQGSELAAAYQNYVAFLDAAPRTVQTYTGNIRQFIKWLQKNGIRQPARQDIIAYREELKERCKPTTVQGYITALRLFFSWTAQAGIYPNIADHIKGAKLDAEHKKDYLSASQVQDILSNIDTSTARGKRDYCIIALMVNSGRCPLAFWRVFKYSLKGLSTAGTTFI